MHKILEYLMSDTTGFILKLSSGIAAAGFGMFGIGTKTREDNGALTPNGRRALIGVVVAGVLAIGTSIYDFASDKKKAKQNDAKDDRLIFSVQSGNYPLKGITGFLVITFQQDFDGLQDYKTMLSHALPPPSLCKTNKAYVCFFKAAGATQYGIPETSHLYPRPNSTVRFVLDNLAVSVTLAKSGPGALDKDYSRLGQFRMRVREMPAQSKMVTFSRNGVFGYRVDNFQIADSVVSESNVYSLIQVFPGFVAAMPEMANPFFCQLLKSVDCIHDVMPALAHGMKLDDMLLRFQYPKALRFLPDNRDVQCELEKGRSVVLPIPKEMDVVDSVGNMPALEKPEAYKAKVCPILAKFGPD